MTSVIDRPELSFDMFQVGRRAMRLATSGIQGFFGQDNFYEFRNAGRSRSFVSIPEESRLRVDRQVHAKVGEMFGMDGRGLWLNAIQGSVDTLESARHILFPDQERQASLTTNMAWDPGKRPSTVLERLTMSGSLIGDQFKYEQGRQLGLALLCAEVLSRDENGNARAVMGRINDFLEERLFRGKRGDPGIYPIFSYHDPVTNKLVGLSSSYTNVNPKEGFLVKSLSYPVRTFAVRASKEENVELVHALYDPRDKHLAAAVIKAKQRSLKAAQGKSNGAIETSPYAKDQLGFRLIIMEGGYPLRDKVTASLEMLFQEFKGYVAIEDDNEVDLNNGNKDRVRFNRKQLFIEDLRNPIEVIVQTLPDYISSLYEVGEFDPQKGMHNGPAHDLYKLRIVSDIAEYLWPQPIFGIDLKAAKKAGSFEYAASLIRKQRV